MARRREGRRVNLWQQWSGLVALLERVAVMLSRQSEIGGRLVLSSGVSFTWYHLG